MRHHNGFTVIELIVVLVLVGIIALFGSSFLLYGLYGYQQSTNNSQAALSMKPTVDVLGTKLADIIEVTCLTSSGGEVEMQFVNSMDDTETLTASGSTGVFNLSGFNIVSGISSPSLTVNLNGDNAENFVLTYTLDVIDQQQTMRFSPRTIIDMTAVPSCTP